MARDRLDWDAEERVQQLQFNQQRLEENPPEWGVWRKDPHHDGEGGEQ